MDIRQADINTKSKSRPNRPDGLIRPNLIADFQQLPLPDNHFRLVLFDPPHIHSDYDNILINKYGKLPGNWQSQYTKAFAEAFRVLKPKGLLIFKWAENTIPIKKILDLTPNTPLFGHRTAKTTHWITFEKPCHATTR